MKQLFYTAQKVAILMDDLERLGILPPEWFKKLSPREIRLAANGVGADWMSNASRRAVTAWYGAFAPIALLHDVAAVYHNDGTRQGFEQWNAECFGNLCPFVWRRYAWYDPRRYYLQYQARHLCFALKKFGWKAWCDAYQEGGKYA